MATRNDLVGRTASAKRRYRRTIKDMIVVLQGQLEAIENDDFEVSSAVDSGAFHLIQEANRLKALIEVEE